MMIVRSSVLLSLSLLLFTAFAAAAAVQEFRILVQQPLERLPSHRIINKVDKQNSTSLTLVPLRVTGPWVRFTAAAYRDEATGVTLPVGPTIRVKRGGEYRVQLRNGLPLHLEDPARQTVLGKFFAANNATHNWFHNALLTNLHSHGLHTDTGVKSQGFAASGNYTSGDNPFFALHPGSNESVTIDIKVPANHLPGLHWYHPHPHGSSVLQAGTAHGVIVIEDDNDLWLPATNGCGPVSEVLSKASDTILDIQLYFFSKPNPLNGTHSSRVQKNLDEVLKENNITKEGLKKLIDVTSNMNNGNFQFMSKESHNPFCCDGGAANNHGTANFNSITGPGIKGRGQNFYLVNGGYQPVISLQQNTWARWRMLNSASKGFTVVKIVDAATNKTSKDCEMMLIAKDGVYLMEIPRRIQGMLLSAANRAEILVRCSGAPGTKYYLWAGDSEPFSSNNFNNDDESAVDHMARYIYIKQDILATILMTDEGAAATSTVEGNNSTASSHRTSTAAYQLQAAKTSKSDSVLQQDLQERVCTPRRPPYAADLRDANLAANGYDKSDIAVINTGFRSKYLPAPLTKSLYMQWGCGVIKKEDRLPGREREYHEFSLPDPEPLTLQLGKIVQMNFWNTEFHPFHIHINPYQIQELATDRLCNNTLNEHVCSFTSYFEPGDYHDTLTLPMMLHSPVYEYPTALRFQPGEFSGYTLMHCHFLMHEDTGCMSVVWYECPTQGPDEQDGKCPGFTWPVHGDVDVSGTVKLPKLSAGSSHSTQTGTGAIAAAASGAWSLRSAGKVFYIVCTVALAVIALV